MYKLGLIGYPISHSFSKKYFDLKFKNEKTNNFSYSLCEINTLKHLDKLIFENSLIGLNVTRPYKKDIIKYLNRLDELAEESQSVNTVFIHPKTKNKFGFNTDIIGFEKLLNDFNLKRNTKALILGSGGASNTVSYFLKNVSGLSSLDIGAGEL